MLERNRGARRDRSRHKKAHAVRALRAYLSGPDYSDITHEKRKQAERQFFRNQGRNELRDHKCGDCFNGGPCDWCNGGAMRKQQQLHDSLDADTDGW